MARRSFEDANCSIARAMDVLGDAWSLLILREAFLGCRRFADFEANLDISKNVLTQRLSALVEAGVLERHDAGRHGPRYEYLLTPMGKDLSTVLTALRQWGDRWLFGPGKEPVLAVDRRTGRPISPLRIQAEDGAPLPGRYMALVPGPGASQDTLRRYAALAEGRREDADG